MENSLPSNKDGRVRSLKKNSDVYLLIDSADRGTQQGEELLLNSDIGRSAKLASIELAGIKVVQVSESVIKKMEHHILVYQLGFLSHDY